MDATGAVQSVCPTTLTVPGTCVDLWGLSAVIVQVIVDAAAAVGVADGGDVDVAVRLRWTAPG